MYHLVMSIRERRNQESVVIRQKRRIHLYMLMTDTGIDIGSGLDANDND